MLTILELLFPSTCILCKNPARDLCFTCAAEIYPSKLQGTISGVNFRAGAIYGEQLAKLILFAKEENFLSARNVLANYLVAAYMQCAPLERDEQISLIPIPSSRSANRKRGYRHSSLLALGLRDALRSGGNHKVELLDCLSVNRKISDQSTLTKSERQRNVEGAYSFTPTKAGKVFLVDDLLTTGSSMREAIRCLKAAGIAPYGALCAGVSPHLIS